MENKISANYILESENVQLYSTVEIIQSNVIILQMLKLWFREVKTVAWVAQWVTDSWDQTQVTRLLVLYYL